MNDSIDLDFAGVVGDWLPLVALLLSGGGIWMLLAARATAKAANRQAGTADWSALMAYWQKEIGDLRADNREHEKRILGLEQTNLANERYIERLEDHIWNQLPPPPPPREDKRTGHK